MNFYNEYCNIIADVESWNPTRKKDIDVSVDKVFYYPDSYNFIFELFWYDSNLRALSSTLHKWVESIPARRLSHTISLYLLGIKLANAIGFDKFHLLNWDNDLRRNFLHHWSAICLFLDIGYAFENRETSELQDIHSLDDFSKRLKLKHCYHKDCAPDLVEHYFNYRIIEHHRVDHGIAGAMLLYDYLLSQSEQQEKIDKEVLISIREKEAYGTDVIQTIEAYSQVIALHNMWYADSEEAVKKYKKHALTELIPDPENSHLIKFVDNPILFLLCFTDTIEPIKACLGRDFNLSTYADDEFIKRAYAALKENEIEVTRMDALLSVQFNKGKSLIFDKAESTKNWLKTSSDEKEKTVSIPLSEKECDSANRKTF